MKAGEASEKSSFASAAGRYNRRFAAGPHRTRRVIGVGRVPHVRPSVRGPKKMGAASRLLLLYGPGNPVSKWGKSFATCHFAERKKTAGPSTTLRSGRDDNSFVKLASASV